MRKSGLQIVVSDRKGRIFNLPGFEPAGMKAGHFFRLVKREFIKLPQGSELFMLPDRRPVGYDSDSGRFIMLEDFFSVAVFPSPGYDITYSSAYKEVKKSSMLPLFSYGAACFYKGDFYIAALRVDRELRQDLRFMDMRLAGKNMKEYRKIFPSNRLVRHLEGCAFTYGCPAAKNFFLKRYEAPLPTSPYCNAACIGCISYQPDNKCTVTQPRIKFFPAPEEVAEVALYHIRNVKDPVVSFGQGCEGEPLLAADVLEKSIRLIRRKTSKGIINLNTNASRPDIIAGLFDAGLDSIRVSMNSAREDYYARYYKPRGYGFSDVEDSIKIAKKKKGFVSINYLVMPGFTDSKQEFSAFRDFTGKYKVDMIQWRNLNFDPVRYFKEMKISVVKEDLIGIREVMHLIKRSFPGILMGYFNPSKRRMKRV